MPVRKIKQCIFVQSIMDCVVNNVRSGGKKWYLIPKADEFWYSEEVGNFFKYYLVLF